MKLLLLLAFLGFADSNQNDWLQLQLRTLERQVAERLVPGSEPLPTPFLNIRWSDNQEHFEAVSKTGARCKGRVEKAKQVSFSATSRLLDLRCESLTTQLSGQRHLIYQLYQLQLNSVTEMNVKADLHSGGKRQLCDGVEPCLSLTAPNVGALKIVEDHRNQPAQKPLASSEAVVLNLPVPGTINPNIGGRTYGKKEKTDEKANESQISQINSEENDQKDNGETLGQKSEQEGNQEVSRQSPEKNGKGQIISPIAFPQDYGLQTTEAAEQSP